MTDTLTPPRPRPGDTLVPDARRPVAPRAVDRIARGAALAVLRRLRHGELEIVDGAERHRFGSVDPSDPLRATVTVHSPAFYRAMLTGGSLALAWAYIDGAWDTDDPVSLTRIACRNLGRIDDIRAAVGPVLTNAQRAIRWFDRNTPSRSARNIHRHYDIGNEFFALMMDATMQYSCGLYERRDMTLHEAQVAKLDRACRWLRLTPDDHVLEIGAGWGGFAVHAAQNYGCHVTAATISREQHDFMVRKVAAAGLEGRVSVVMQDYRDMRGRYDKLVHIEVIESIGPQYLERFLATCSRLLEPDGLMFVQAIVSRHRDFRYSRYGRGFASDIIFPGGCLPSVTAMLNCIGRATDMRVLELEDITPGYPPTLLAWRDNVDANIERIRAMGFDERFLRMWRLYLSYCTGAFTERRIGDVQMLFAKPRFRDETVRETVPAQREVLSSAGY
jgi:cyclopropane-fatty-acyl-phospholipid synthase